MVALPTIYTMEEAASHLRVSRRVLQELIKAHPFYRNAGRRKVFTTDDLSKLIEALRSTPSAPTSRKMPSHDARTEHRDCPSHTTE